MRATRSGCGGWRAALLGAAVCVTGGAAAAQGAERLRYLSGEEISQRAAADQWETLARIPEGYEFSVTFYPDGRLRCINVRGGGAVAGEWSVRQAEGQLCLRWLGAFWPESGCYRMVSYGPGGFELRDAQSENWAWRFSVLNY